MEDPKLSHKNSRHLRWYACALGIIAVVGCFVLPPVLGAWLVTADPLEHAGAIVVFGGEVPFRAMEAARIYQQGLAPMVWLTQGALHDDDLELARLGINPTPEYVYSEEVLKRLGVPSAAIRLLPQPVRNTAEEVRCIAQAAAAGDIRKLIRLRPSITPAASKSSGTR